MEETSESTQSKQANSNQDNFDNHSENYYSVNDPFQSALSKYTYDSYTKTLYSLSKNLATLEALKLDSKIESVVPLPTRFPLNLTPQDLLSQEKPDKIQDSAQYTSCNFC
jgi:hypothetical protein